MSHEIKDEYFYKFTINKNLNTNQDFIGVAVNESRYKILILVLILFFISLFFRAFFLQIYKGENYLSLAEGNRSRSERLEASRGLIYDKNKKLLVHNEPVYSAYIVPNELPIDSKQRQDIIDNISKVLDIDSLQLFEILKNYSQRELSPVIVAENLEYQEALVLEIAQQDIPGLYLKTSTRRFYEHPESLAHVLGYIGKLNEQEIDYYDKNEYVLTDAVGKTGLELSYEKILRGQFGKRDVEINVRGREQAVLYEKIPVHGNDLILSLDFDLQNFVYKTLTKNLAKLGKSKGVVIVQDPKTGGVLSAVSIPSYDNNLFSKGISVKDYSIYTSDKDNPLFNRFIKGEYPSGSTIKILVGAAALEEGVITDKTSFLSTGGIYYDDRWFFPDWKAGGHGYTNIYKAIADSVNTFFYIIGGGFEKTQGLGLDKLVEYYKEFGLGSVLGIDIPGERPGLVPTREWKLSKKKEEWYIGDTYHMAIGQGDVLVTPLQVSNYTSYFANKGKVFKPKFVEAVVDSDGYKKEVSNEIIIQDVVDEYYTEVIRKGMRRGVTEGSARFLSDLPFEIAGKTGTAQFQENKNPHASFTGFGPYEDAKYVVTVLIEEGGEGSSVAVPIAKEIFNYLFTKEKQELTPD